MQMATSDTTHNYLHESFISALQRSLTSSLDRIGKGWYNLHESNYETYSFSKLKKLLTAARFMAEDTIRHLTLTSLTSFTQFMSRVCDVTAVVKSTKEVALSRGSTTRRVPLLTVDLQVSSADTAARICEVSLHLTLWRWLLWTLCSACCKSVLGQLVALQTNCLAIHCSLHLLSCAPQYVCMETSHTCAFIVAEGVAPQPRANGNPCTAR